MNEVPPELIFNWDQTALHLVSADQWTMHRAGEKVISISNSDEKHQVTAAFAKVTFLHHKSSTKERQSTPTQKFPCPPAAIFGTVTTTGQMKRP